MGQVALGFLGLDLPADMRDLLYDITNWKLTPSHALQTILDAAALLPVVGSIKYSDEARKLGFTQIGQYSHGKPIFKKGNRYITPDIDGHIGGRWKMTDSIKGLAKKSTRMGTYDENLKRIGD